MIKYATLLLMSITMSHGNVSYDTRQGLPPQTITSAPRKPLPPIPNSFDQDLQSQQQNPALPPHSAAIPSNKKQGILVGDLKLKFTNLRKLISATDGLLHENNLVQKYGNNLHMVSSELDKLELAVGDGRSLESIHDQEVIANSTFGKNKFDQEKYNNLLGITKQTAMSACSEAAQQHKVNARSGQSGQDLNGYINTCNSLKGTQDVATFVAMVDKLSEHSERIDNQTIPYEVSMTSNNLGPAKIMLKILYPLTKSKLLTKHDNVSMLMKNLMSKYKELDKLSRSKKGPNHNLTHDINILIDGIHSATNQVCKAIGQNVPAMLERVNKGKKSEMIQRNTQQALTNFNRSCGQFAQYHTNKDIIMFLNEMLGQEKAIVNALKGK